MKTQQTATSKNAPFTQAQFQPHPDEFGHFELTYFQVVHDAELRGQPCLSVPLGNMCETKSAAQDELVALKAVHPKAYVIEGTMMFSLDHVGDIEEYQSFMIQMQRPRQPRAVQRAA